MKWIISRYNHDVSYLPQYTEDYVMYDRSEVPIEDPRVIKVPNIGSDWYDKFTFIINNYDNLPDVAVYTKANIFKYITPEEFELIKDNKTFTPILTQNHRTYSDVQGRVCYYQDGLYWERNNQWYLGQFHCKEDPLKLMLMLGIADKPYVPFAPGSNYLLTRDNIRQHHREDYEYLRSLLDYDIYPGEAQIIERGAYEYFRPKV